MAAFRAFLASLLLAASFWTLTVTPAEACVCEELTLEERVARADLIVIGTTTDQRPIDPLPTPLPTPKTPPQFEPYVINWEDSIETELTVDEYLKGRGPKELALVSRGRLDCTLVPYVDVRYLFFLPSRDDSRPEISTCSGQVQITAGDEAALARIEEIRELAHGTDSGSDVILLFIAVAGAGAVLLSAGVFYFRRTGINDEN